MKPIIGSAKIDENRGIVGGARGDQKQTSNSDYKGEVSLQDFYIANKGWDIIRAKDIGIAKKMADLMILACNNINIGYSQSDRNDILSKGVRTTIPTNCDCSSLVREIIKEATNKDPGSFNTSNELMTLTSTGNFTYVPFTTEKELQVGDILVTKTKGHTAIVVQSFNQVAYVPMKYVNNHIYMVRVDDLNVREKYALENLKDIAKCPITRKLNTGDRVTCLKSVEIDGAMWICMGINNSGKEEWCCGDNGRKSYVK